MKKIVPRKTANKEVKITKKLTKLGIMKVSMIELILH